MIPTSTQIRRQWRLKLNTAQIAKVLQSRGIDITESEVYEDIRAMYNERQPKERKHVVTDPVRPGQS